MQIFACGCCNQRLYFENTQCLGCGRMLGFVPDRMELSPLESIEGDLFRPAGQPGAPLYRRCSNYVQNAVCNWMEPASTGHGLCRACRLTEVIPDLSSSGNHRQWGLLEAAKRRLVYSLLHLGLPVVDRLADPGGGLSFRFLSRVPGQEIVTGHADGVITVCLDEADSVQRERTRVALEEPYRTLIGHLRHESGHYYWYRLVDGSTWLEPFREMFGDERVDYQGALQRHYSQPRTDWRGEFVSCYASAHPWEDWAECWAHYLHITDSLETALAFGMCHRYGPGFEDCLEAWFEVTEAVNALNRSMGLPDLYPFVLGDRVQEKLNFIHRLIEAWCPARGWPWRADSGRPGAALS